MQINILEYLDNSVKKYPEKTAFVGTNSLTFSQIDNITKSIASFIINENNGETKLPVVVFMEKDSTAIATFLGVIRSGCYYVPIDLELPRGRIKMILESVSASIIICSESTKEIAKDFITNEKVVLYDEVVKTVINLDSINEVTKKVIDTDPIYIVFTSGSTGVPKGIVGNHKSTIDYIENLCPLLEVDENTIFGNQAPLYLDACFKEIYSTLKFGGTTYLTPKELFLQPVKLVEYLNENKINTISWVVSGLKIISMFKTFDIVVPKYLKVVAFGSELFPVKQFNQWVEALPQVKYINLYGPTECTGMSTYYVVNRTFEDKEVIPIGKAFKNTEIFLLKDDNQLAGSNEDGEICIRGTCVTQGYYNNLKITEEAFVQNPLNKNYREFIYKTGDLGRYNQYNELVFISRKDYQIKHMGYRIELPEIELIANTLNNVDNTACLYNSEKDKIILCYVGDLETSQIKKELNVQLPKYMMPNKFHKLEQLPLTPNGKIDKVELEKQFIK